MSSDNSDVEKYLYETGVMDADEARITWEELDTMDSLNLYLVLNRLNDELSGEPYGSIAKDNEVERVSNANREDRVQMNYGQQQEFLKMILGGDITDVGFVDEAKKIVFNLRNEDINKIKAEFDKTTQKIAEKEAKLQKLNGYISEPDRYPFDRVISELGQELHAELIKVTGEISSVGGFFKAAKRVREIIEIIESIDITKSSSLAEFQKLATGQQRREFIFQVQKMDLPPTLRSRLGLLLDEYTNKLAIQAFVENANDEELRLQKLKKIQENEKQELDRLEELTLVQTRFDSNTSKALIELIKTKLGVFSPDREKLLGYVETIAKENLRKARESATEFRYAIEVRKDARKRIQRLIEDRLPILKSEALRRGLIGKEQEINQKDEDFITKTNAKTARAKQKVEDFLQAITPEVIEEQTAEIENSRWPEQLSPIDADIFIRHIETLRLQRGRYLTDAQKTRLDVLEFVIQNQFPDKYKIVGQNSPESPFVTEISDERNLQLLMRTMRDQEFKAPLWIRNSNNQHKISIERMPANYAGNGIGGYFLMETNEKNKMVPVTFIGEEAAQKMANEFNIPITLVLDFRNQKTLLPVNVERV